MKSIIKYCAKNRFCNFHPSALDKWDRQRGFMATLSKLANQCDFPLDVDVIRQDFNGNNITKC